MPLTTQWRASRILLVKINSLSPSRLHISLLGRVLLLTALFGRSAAYKP
jgi:hypothetical protein